MDLAVTVNDLPDECLAYIFRSLSSANDHNRCSAVCRRWLKIEGQSRDRLCLTLPKSISLASILSIFSRFDPITELILNCQWARNGDKALILISRRCPNLTSLAICYSDLTDTFLEELAKNYKALKKFSCRYCTLGQKGFNALIHHCSDLEQLSVAFLRRITAADKGAGAVAASSSSLKTICLQDTNFLYPIVGAKNLTILKLVRCDGNWDQLLHLLVDRVPSLVEVHLERLRISDIGLKAISKCWSLESLHLLKNEQCSNAGVVAVAKGCKHLRELHIDVGNGNHIGDAGLIAVAECCPNLEDLILIGMNLRKTTLDMLASNCQSLKRSTFCKRSEIGCIDMYDIAANESASL